MKSCILKIIDNQRNSVLKSLSFLAFQGFCFVFAKRVALLHHQVVFTVAHYLVPGFSRLFTFRSHFHSIPRMFGLRGCAAVIVVCRNVHFCSLRLERTIERSNSLAWLLVTIRIIPVPPMFDGATAARRSRSRSRHNTPHAG